MKHPSFSSVATVVFGIVALGHAARLAWSWPVLVGTLVIPFWLSWLGLIVAGALCAWGLCSCAASCRQC